MVLCKYHSVFLTRGGALYTCGKGQGGRLASGHEDHIMEPRLVKVNFGKAVHIAAGADHTVVINEHGQVSFMRGGAAAFT